MQSYTTALQKPLELISWEDDHFMEELLRVAQLFRPFSAAMDEFLVERGYTGNLSDVDAKTAFISGAFRRANMGVPREVRAWFAGQPVKRDTTARKPMISFGESIPENVASTAIWCKKPFIIFA